MLIHQPPVSLQCGNLSDCDFYHSMDLPSGEIVEGQWDLRGRIAEYLGQVNFSGRRVLDIGTASGFLTFEMEKLGASVVSVEADSARRINLLPFERHPIIQNYESWIDKADLSLNRQKASYWYAHRAFNSKAKAFYGDLYCLPSELGKFDLVVVAQILVHLRDPAGALASIAKFSDDTLIVAEGMIDTEEPMARYLPVNPDSPASIWWHWSTGLYREYLGLLGFDVVSKSTSAYRCCVYDTDVPITTLVCRRK